MQRGGEISVLAARARRWRRVRTVRRGLMVAAVVFGAYLLLLLEPGPLFAHEARDENIVLHARAPFHTRVARRIGRLRYHRLAVWQREGDADYLAKGDDFDFDAVLDDFRTGSPALDPERSGSYLRHHLLTAHALNHLGLSPEELFAHPRPSEPLEAALREGRP
jgi:hypothetical protein